MAEDSAYPAGMANLRNTPQSNATKPCSRWRCVVVSTQTFADGCIAVGAGVIAEYALAAAGSPVAVFDLAAILLVIVLVAIIATWGENYGGAQSKQQEDSKEQDQQQQRSVSKSVTDALGTLASDPRVLLQGLVQSLFEGVMYSFVMLWVPALQAKAQGDATLTIASRSHMPSHAHTYYILFMHTPPVRRRRL